ncbi:hypothetical protein [Brumimicrobium aurantiacum]|uniref:Uncharacterized protein n=1 Tax=Brumimicrobium aurantiacum TaxID=1737063 RepID=A0A3E1EZF5_9FLAO|nr:hypothetical protein [Brumimicrobium aurantiacum]RFC54863.1 hypothetical protein DXU93_03315 [Brumimicrobium aurantiacum]
MNYENLEKTELIKLLKDRDEDLKDITRVILKMLASLNLEPKDLKVDPNATEKEIKKAKRAKQKKVMGTLSDIVSSMMFNSSALEERFSFLSQFEPLLMKHENLIAEIQAETENNG